MPVRVSYTINQKQLLVELRAADPMFKREADKIIQQEIFLPAVEGMKEEFITHPVTQEIAGGAGAPNVSRTLEAPFREEKEEDTTPNLWGFLGFDTSGIDSEGVIESVLKRLDPSHPDGPKMIFEGKDKEKINYRYSIKPPSEDAIYDDTPLPWLSRGGPSWVQRMEQGIPGIGQFLNVNRPSSRSGGGIQITGVLRGGRFRPVSYLSRILNNFMRRASGRQPSATRRGFRD